MASKTHTLRPSTFETIDSTVLDWVDGILNLYATTNAGWKKVPVVWLTAERSFQIKNKKETRDIDSGALIFPLITIERATVEKTKVSDRPIPGHVFPRNDYRRGSFTIGKMVNQHKTAEFANADSTKMYGQKNFPRKDMFGRKMKNEKIVYKTITVPWPVYHNITYAINLRTDYQQQMNEMMAPFLVYTGGFNQFILEKDGHAYEAFIETSYGTENNIASLAEEEKKYEAVIKLRVLGYLLGSDKNQEGPKITIRENPVEIKFRREHVILGDINEYNKKEGYRG